MTDFLSKWKHVTIISSKYNVHHTTVLYIYIVLSSYTLPKEDYLLSNNENFQYINLQIVVLTTTIIHIVLFYMIKLSIRS